MLLGFLHSNKHATHQHHHRTQQAAAELTFSQEEPGPQDGEDATQLEERGHIADETKGNGGETEERGHSCNEHCQQQSTRMAE